MDLQKASLEEIRSELERRTAAMREAEHLVREAHGKLIMSHLPSLIAVATHTCARQSDTVIGFGEDYGSCVRCVLLYARETHCWDNEHRLTLSLEQLQPLDQLKLNV